LPGAFAFGTNEQMLSIHRGIVSIVNRSMVLTYQKLIIWTLNHILSVALKFLQGVHDLGVFIVSHLLSE